VDGESVVSWWIEAFTELHRLLRTSGVERTGPDGAVFPTEFFAEGAAELVAFVPVAEVPPLPGRVEVVERPAARYAVASYDGPMVDLDAAYSAVGRAVTEQALAADGPVVERYLPLGDPEDLLAHRTEVCWPVTGPVSAH
jgi:effector-binding domain-containing protein